MAKIPDEILGPLKTHVSAIGRMFKSGRITIIIRGPEIGNAVGDLVLTTDNPMLALGALKARIVSEAEIYASQGEQMRVYEKPRTETPPNIDNDNPNARTRPSGDNFKRGI